VVRPPSPSTLLQSVPPPRLVPSRVPPLMGFASPPRRHLLARVHSRRLRRSAFGCRIPTRQSRSAHMVSHHLDGFLREQAVSLLHLTASLRFAPFPLPRPLPDAKASSPVIFGGFPAARSHPSKNSPRPQPYRVTAAVALLTLPPTLRAVQLMSHTNTPCPTLPQPRSPKKPPLWRNLQPIRRCANGRCSVPAPPLQGSLSRSCGAPTPVQEPAFRASCAHLRGGPRTLR
jgi:hypothetical protein